MSKKHEDFLAGFLDQNKERSYIGGELKKQLMKEFPKLTEENARRIIANCCEKGKINSTEPVTFQNHQYVYFSLRSERSYPLFKDNIQKYKPQLHRVIFALMRGGGILSLNALCNISGVTLKEHSHDITLAGLLKDLEQLGLAELVETHGLRYVRFKHAAIIPQEEERLKDELEDKNLLLMLSTNWLVRSNIVDAEQLCFFGRPNEFEGIVRNDTYWDAFGFTNTVGLGGGTKAYQTMVIVDFLHSATYEEYDFAGFKSRVDRMIFSVKREKRKVLPIVIASDFSPAAVSLIKRSGYMCFRLGTILGSGALTISKQYRQSVAEMDDRISKNDCSGIADRVSRTCEVIRGEGNEVNYGNLKGSLFEYLMYPVLHRIFCKQGDRITHNFKRRVDGEEFECDYRVETENENIFIELKGYEKSYVIPLGKYHEETGETDRQSVKWFLCHTYELAKRCVGPERQNRFCYMTTAQIEEAAKEIMRKRKKDKPDELEHYYDHDGLVLLLKKLEMKKELEVIEQFYC